MIGCSVIGTHGSVHHLGQFVWFNSLATKHTWSVPGMYILGGQEENKWLMAVSSLIEGQ